MPMWMPMPKVVFWMSAWYLCSLGTLFMNKVILTRLDGRAHMLGIVQMTMTAALGAAKVYLPVVLASHSSCCGNRKTRTALETGNYMVLHPAPADKLKKQSREHHTFWRDMVFVGVMRGATVLLGLVSLSHVAVSFVETIKASAPLFTVFFAQWMLGEVTPAPVVASLFPVMIGLVMCSATEMSFDTIGFVAAVSNNCIDCVQNVFSKRLLSTSLSPVELQFYTSAAAVLMQFPVMVFTASSELAHFREVDRSTAMLLLADGLCFHMQSVTAYFTMSLISPVSQSVANTVKRSLLIVISIWYFGNEITVYSAFGMACVCVGVALYNSARLNAASWSTVTSQAKEAVGSAVETEMLEVTNGWGKGRAEVSSMRKGRDDGVGTRAIVV
jgi:solute carrier family 35 protein E2